MAKQLSPCQQECDKVSAHGSESMDWEQEAVPTVASQGAERMGIPPVTFLVQPGLTSQRLPRLQNGTANWELNIQKHEPEAWDWGSGSELLSGMHETLD